MISLRYKICMMTFAELCATATIGVLIWAILLDMFKNLLSSIPGFLIDYLKKHLTVRMTIRSTDDLFNITTEWLARQPYAKKARNVRMLWNPYLKEFMYVPGIGKHYIWFKKRPVIIELLDGATMPVRSTSLPRSVTEQIYEITVIGRGRNVLEALIKAIVEIRKSDNTKSTILNIYSWRQQAWFYGSQKKKRELSTVYVDDGLRDNLIKDMSWFMNNEAWYHTRGIPYHRGYLLYGPPGTGKTTLATALAGHFDRPICIINLTTIGDDDELMTSFTSAPKDAIILIEDVDTFKISNKRSSRSDNPTSTPSERGVTLSGLLNAIDGVAASEGRILVMTTNYYEKLDSALIRGGRVDKKIAIGPLTASSVEHMFCNFFPDFTDRKRTIYDFAISTTEMPCIHWQELFMKYQEHPEDLFVYVSENMKEVRS